MPTFATTTRFDKDLAGLTDAQKSKFKDCVKKFVEDLKRDGIPRASLRIRGLQSAPGVFEFTWEGSNGRATFQYGEQIKPGEVHIVWRRIGTHEVFENP